MAAGSSSKKSHPASLIIITGQSGAGRSMAIKALEDNGFLCVDNLPLGLMESVVEYFVAGNHPSHNFALGMDIRDPEFVTNFSSTVKKISKLIAVKVIFLSADEEILVSRYSSTRRKHPLLDTGGDLVAAIRREATLLAPLKKVADFSFDTSTWAPRVLTRTIEEQFVEADQQRKLHVIVQSFGFKHGLPRPIDTLFDVRFLTNPFFIPELKDISGLEKPVQDFLSKDANTIKFRDELSKMMRFLLPLYYREGKHYFRIAIGCTGGRHRSVAMAEWLVQDLKDANLENLTLELQHRDQAMVN